MRFSLLSQPGGINLRQGKANRRGLNAKLSVGVMVGSQVKNSEEQLQVARPGHGQKEKRLELERVSLGPRVTDKRHLGTDREQRCLGHPFNPLYLRRLQGDC